MKIPTIKIALGDDYAVINESDFDPDVHERFEADDDPVTLEPTVSVSATATVMPNKAELVDQAKMLGITVLARDTVADLQAKIADATSGDED